MITLTMVDQGRSDFYVVLTMSLRTLESKQMLISLLFKVIQFLKLGSQNLGSYMRLTCEMSLISYQILKVALQRIMVKTT